MILESRWFPLMAAVVQTLRHAALVAHGYWRAAGEGKSLDLMALIRRDLEQPMFAPYMDCLAWSHFGGPAEALVALDGPAYWIAMVLRAAIDGQAPCFEQMMGLRGQLFTAAFVPLVWYLTGASLRRLARRRWRPETGSPAARFLVSLPLIIAPFGALLLIGGAVAVLLSPLLGLRLLAMAFWLLYLPALAAERLRVWPFHSIRRPAP